MAQEVAPPATGLRITRFGDPSLDVMRACLAAVELRARNRTWPEIARELGLASPQDAKRAVEQGLAVTPAEDAREVRRLEDMRLNMIAKEAWAVVDNPPPLAQLGKIVRDENGDPVPDEAARSKALENLVKVSQEMRKLHGANAPKTSIVLTDSILQERKRELMQQLGLDDKTVQGMIEPPGGD